MKAIMTAALLSLSLSSFAGPLNPKSMTCDELNTLLEERGSLYVVYGLLGISRGTMYAESSDAHPCNGDVQQLNLRTSDGFCLSGYLCKPDRRLR